MVNSFEELTTPKAEKSYNAPKVEPFFRPLIWASVLIYLSATVFLPFILLKTELFGTLPLFFSGIFFLATIIFVAVWFAWVLMIKKTTGEVGPRLLLPLLAIPASVVFFYVLTLILSLFH